jgi:hypothetical protein
MTRGGNLFGNGGNFGLFESTITLLYENDYLLENIDGWSSFRRLTLPVPLVAEFYLGSYPCHLWIL